MSVFSVECFVVKISSHRQSIVIRHQALMTTADFRANSSWHVSVRDLRYQQVENERNESTRVATISEHFSGSKDFAQLHD
jgi:hypothetical protein